MKSHKKVRQGFYNSGIGPDTDEEASAIHKGIYDAIGIWRPDSFVKQLLKVRDTSFEDFEDRERHYYYGFFVSFFLLKYLGVLTVLKVFPMVSPYI